MNSIKIKIKIALSKQSLLWILSSHGAQVTNNSTEISVIMTETGLLFRQKVKDKNEQHMECFIVLIGDVLLEILIQTCPSCLGEESNIMH